MSTGKKTGLLRNGDTKYMAAKSGSRIRDLTRGETGAGSIVASPRLFDTKRAGLLAPQHYA